MKEVCFKKIKGKLNLNPQDYSIVFEDNVIEMDHKTVTIKCSKFLDFKNFVLFLKRYIFMQLDYDENKLEIYIPKTHIFSVKTVYE